MTTEQKEPTSEEFRIDWCIRTLRGLADNDRKFLGDRYPEIVAVISTLKTVLKPTIDEQDAIRPGGGSSISAMKDSYTFDEICQVEQEGWLRGKALRVKYREMFDKKDEWTMPGATPLIHLVNTVPLLQSILYDLNLLPEQIDNQLDWDKMYAVACHFDTNHEISKPPVVRVSKATARLAKVEDADGWVQVEDFLPICDLTPNSFGVPIVIDNPDGKGEINAFYGCRASDKPNFYWSGAVLTGVKRWKAIR